MEHHTTTQLQKMVAERTGKPCNSRNREALLRKLAKMDAEPAPAPAPTPPPPPVAPKRARKPAKKPRAGSTHHAAALAFVRKAMARKSPPSLRALCEEMSAKGIQKPRGGTDWWPSSVQNLIRQVRA